jgi:ketosteroid isomerase-like protein
MPALAFKRASTATVSPYDIRLKEAEMTISTQASTGFDSDAYARAFAAWDVPGLLKLYADDMELTLVTPEHPPARPLRLQGSHSLKRMWEQGIAAGAEVRILRSVVGDGCAAFTYSCEFPGKHVAIANALVDVVDGLIVRQHEVLVGGAAEEVVAADDQP